MFTIICETTESILMKLLLNESPSIKGIVDIIKSLQNKYIFQFPILNFSDHN